MIGATLQMLLSFLRDGPVSFFNWTLRETSRRLQPATWSGVLARS
jgi:hypothetical protein